MPRARRRSPAVPEWTVFGIGQPLIYGPDDDGVFRGGLVDRVVFTEAQVRAAWAEHRELVLARCAAPWALRFDGRP